MLSLHVLDKKDKELHDNFFNASLDHQYRQTVSEAQVKACDRASQEHERFMRGFKETFWLEYRLDENGYATDGYSLELKPVFCTTPTGYSFCLRDQISLIDDLADLALDKTKSPDILAFQHLDGTYGLVDLDGTVLASHCKDVTAYRGAHNSFYRVQKTENDAPLKDQAVINHKRTRLPETLVALLSLAGVMPRPQGMQSHAPYMRNYAGRENR